MPGLYDYLLNEIHVGDAPPALSEILPHRRRAGHAGAVIVLLAAGLGAIWVLLHRMKVPLKRAPLHLASLRCLRMMLFSGIITPYGKTALAIENLHHAVPNSAPFPVQ